MGDADCDVAPSLTDEEFALAGAGGTAVTFGAEEAAESACFEGIPKGSAGDEFEDDLPALARVPELGADELAILEERPAEPGADARLVEDAGVDKELFEEELKADRGGGVTPLAACAVTGAAGV